MTRRCLPVGLVTPQGRPDEFQRLVERRFIFHIQGFPGAIDLAHQHAQHLSGAQFDEGLNAASGQPFDGRAPPHGPGHLPDQGIAGAFIVPGSLALITATFSSEEQGRAFGVWSGASAGLTILGPFVGGILVDTVSWRAVFLVNVPLVLLAWWMIQRFVRESRDEAASGKFDVPGTILSAPRIWKYFEISGCSATAWRITNATSIALCTSP